MDSRRAQGRRRCFTLVELLVVVAIISILAAMLLPTLARSRRLAKRSTCIANYKQMAAGFTLYADDFEGMLPRRGGVLWYAANYGSNGSTWHYPRNAYSILWAIEEYEFGPSTVHPEVGNPALNAPGNFWDPDTMTLQLRQGSNICPYSFLWAWPGSRAGRGS